MLLSVGKRLAKYRFLRCFLVLSCHDLMLFSILTLNFKFRTVWIDITQSILLKIRNEIGWRLNSKINWSKVVVLSLHRDSEDARIQRFDSVSNLKSLRFHASFSNSGPRTSSHRASVIGRVLIWRFLMGTISCAGQILEVRGARTHLEPISPPFSWCLRV